MTRADDSHGGMPAVLVSLNHEPRKQDTLKTVGTSGQLTPGKKCSGRHFELDEPANGELVLRPVRLVRKPQPW